jgi:hypothetical protein
MFQSTTRAHTSRESNPQDEQEKRDQQAQNAVDDAARRMMNDAQQRSLELDRQNIEGRVDDVRAKERQGA